MSPYLPLAHRQARKGWMRKRFACGRETPGRKQDRMSTFSGKWLTTFGPMELSQDGASVRGEYCYMSAACCLEGEVSHGRLVFTYQEPEVRGEGWFELTRGGRGFAGRF